MAQSAFPQRKRTRLREYDYASAGRYFVTVCAQSRAMLFGDVVDARMRLNCAGEMIDAYWRSVADAFPLVWIDAFILMPNHLHAALTILDPEVIRMERELAVSASAAQDSGSVIEERATSLSAIVQWFNTKTTNAYIRGVHDGGWPRFDGRLWQRSFHDRIIRNDREFDLAREYIAANPTRWHEDAENPYRP